MGKLRESRGTRNPSPRHLALASGNITSNQQSGQTTSSGGSSSTATYNADGQQVSSTQTASYVGASGTVTDTVVTTTFNSYDGVGNLTQTSQTSTDNGVYSPKYPSTSETISYTWFGSAEANVVSYKPDTSKGATWTTTYSDTPNGSTLSAAVVDGMNHTNSYVTNAKGQIISRWMNYSPTAQQDLLYIFGGKMMGELSNDGAPADQLGAQQGVISANNVPSSNLWTNTTPVAYANMTESYDPVGGYGDIA